MTTEKKLALLRYLYLNDKTQQFLCNDLFQELINIVPKNKCICKDNISPETRQTNYSSVFSAINEFFNHNPDYRSVVCSLFSHYDQSELETHLLTGFVFYIALTSPEYLDIDIFKDKKSICYSDGPSIADIII